MDGYKEFWKDSTGSTAVRMPWTRTSHEATLWRGCSGDNHKGNINRGRGPEDIDIYGQILIDK